MRTRAPSPSFTLVEIMAATAILSVMFTIMFGILQQTSSAWQAANRRVEASQVARLALDQIASDLENCVAVAQANVVTPGTPAPTNYAYGFVHSGAPAATQPWLPAGIGISQPNDLVFVVTPYAPSQNMGVSDLCEVGYIPAFVSLAAGYSTMRGGRYYLLRHMPLTNIGAGVNNPLPVTDFHANPTAWETTPTGVGTTHRLPFVDNCLKFQVEFFYTNATGQVLTNASWGRPTVSGNTVTWPGNPGGIQGLPMGAVITMCVVDERTAERIWRIRGTQGLSSQELEAIPTNWSAIGADLRSTLQASVLTLQRRVYFKNRTNQ